MVLAIARGESTSGARSDATTANVYEEDSSMGGMRMRCACWRGLFWAWANADYGEPRQQTSISDLCDSDGNDNGDGFGNCWHPGHGQCAVGRNLDPAII
eukprot:6175484-Pyramimonas_sp.AAC.1